MRRPLRRKMVLNRETVRNLGEVGEGRPGIPQTYPDSSPETVCCTASCRHIC